MNKEIMRLIEEIPEIVKTALSAKNKERWGELFGKGAEMKEETEAFLSEILSDAGVCAQLILEIFQDMFESAENIDLSVKSRNLKNRELEAALKTEIYKRL